MGSKKNVSREEALNSILQCTRPLDPITLPLDKALGHAMAEDVYASQDIPPFDRAAMDGYVLSSQDTACATKNHPVRLPVVGEIHPSTAEPTSIGKGQAARIMTGGAIPPGADTVVMDEDVHDDFGTIEIGRPAQCAQFVSKKGQDVTKGTLVAKRGAVIEPALLGLLACLHVRALSVTRRPEVAVLAIGNELIGLQEGPDNPKPDNPKIVASNLYMLSAMIEKQGSQVRFSRITKNGERTITKDLKEGFKRDMVITIGGTAKAKSDLTLAVMQAMGVELEFTGIAMVPGKGTAFGLYRNKPVFALPGTPSAVFTAFHTLVLPTLWKLSGLRDFGIDTQKAILEKDIRKKPGIEHMVQGVVSQRDTFARVFPLTGPDVARLTAMGKANGLIRVPPNTSRLVKGQPVSVQVLDYGGVGFPLECAFPRAPENVPAPPIISIVGKSDAGKTTFLERLVPELKTRGCRVGTIKHDVHGFDIDHQGKDSWRHKQAGAHTVTISSPKKVAVIKDVDQEETIDSLARKYFQDVDIILTEGYKREDKPKIEIFRRSVHRTPLCRGDASLVAVVSDKPLDLGVPRFGLNDITGVADFVEATFLGKASHPNS